MAERLYKKYKEEIVPEIMKLMNYKNTMEAPKITKVVVNIGMGSAADDIKIIEEVANELSQIAGQRAVITRAKKDVSNFKLRKGSPVGCKVTLRKRHMYEFLDRLINVALPSLKDFKGMSDKSFDQGGNYSLGLDEQTIFPEIEFDRVEKVHGMDITIVTNAKSKEEAQHLLRLMGMPFKRQG